MPPPPDSGLPAEDLRGLIDALELDDDARRYLRGRWLDQLRWMEGRAAGARRWYYGLRLTAILGGVAIPALLGWRGASAAAGAAHAAAAVLGVVVAAASSVEGLYRFGERWERYRRGSEALKAEFWSLNPLAGPYREFPDHRAAFPTFVVRVEQVLRDDLEAYFTVPRAVAAATAGAKVEPKSS